VCRAPLVFRGFEVGRGVVEIEAAGAVECGLWRSGPAAAGQDRVVGGLKMPHWLEGAGLVEMGLARHGVGNWDLALGVTEFPG
jgi:hypothetical protein